MTNELLFKPTRMGRIHAARLEHSPRLQRLYALLQDGRRHSTRDCVMNAHVMAISSAITELRANGIAVESGCVGKGLWEYWLPAGQQRKC